MMKVLQRLILSISVLGTVTFINPVYAVNEADCSIWLCLPMGFPSGCSDAKSAFKKRIKKFKPPLPWLGSCLVSGGGESSESSDMSSGDGIGAFIPTREVCSRREREWKRGEWHTYCAEYKMEPSHVIKDRRCKVGNPHRDRPSKPAGCTKTVQYVETFMDGQAYGETYYFDGSGNEIKTH